MSFEYNGVPVELELFHNSGVQDFDVLVPRERLSAAGYKDMAPYELDFIKPEGQFLFCHTKYDKYDETLICKITVDSRFLPFNKDGQIFSISLPEKDNAGKEGPPISLLKLRFVKEQNEIDCCLVVDLGNTRTFALIVDDINQRMGGSSFKTYRLPLKSYSEFPAKTEYGVFNSMLVLESPKKFGNSNSGQQTSPVRIGAEAARLDESTHSSQCQSRYSLSSPKRYFWQEDMEYAGWMAAKYTSDSNAPFEKLSCGFADTMGEEYHVPPDKIPRSAILSGMILELLEQGSNYINSPEFAGAPMKRRISRVCITYPTAWAESELPSYERKLLGGIEIFSGVNSTVVPTLDVGCDEATAVLTGYVFSEIRKYGNIGENWINFVGRTPPFKNATARIAVIDIGGGTSDLVIADVYDDEKGAGVNLNISRVYRDGVNKAGDELVRRIICDILLPCIKDIGLTDFGKKNPKVNEIFNSIYSGTANDADKRDIKRLLIPLAMNIIERLKQTSDDNPQIRARDLIGARYGDIQNYLNEFIKRFGARIRNARIDMPGDIFNSDGSEKLEINVHRSKVEETVNEIFFEISERFCSAISAFDCDLVLFAGKTSELGMVCDVFKESLELPEDKIVSLYNYRIGDWCSLAEGGIIADAKMTTAIGAAVYTLAESGSGSLGVPFRITVRKGALVTRDFYWGIVSNGNPRFKNEDAMLSPQKDNCTIAFTGAPIMIARRAFDSGQIAADLTYEIRLKPDFKKPVAKTMISLKKDVHPDNSVTLIIEKVEGNYISGDPVLREHLEIRHRILFEDDFFVESGKMS